MRRLLSLITAPRIADRRGLRRYVAMATAGSICVALLIDVISQLVFFIDWPTALRSWALTVVIVLVIAIPVLSWIGRAHLALAESRRQMEVLSRTDALTGLPNRRALMEEAERIGAAWMVLVIIDIDHFKRVNDTLGHRAGDLVLRAVSRIMAEGLKEFGQLGRLGGEEFALVSTAQPSRGLLERLDALRDQLSAHPLVAEGQAVLVTISAGAAIRNQRTLDELYSEADRALYAAKRAGRNCICLSSELEDWRQRELERNAA